MIAATTTRRRDMTGIIVAVATTLLMNGLLLVVLMLLDRPRSAPPVIPLPLHRLTSVPPITAPPVANLPAKVTTPAPASASPLAPPMASLPALALSPTASAAMLSMPDLPTIDAARPINMPTVAAATNAAEGGKSVTPTGNVGVGSVVVDEQPVLINGFDLERFYPRSARLRGVEGTSSMRLGINSEGQVVAISIITSDPPGVFDGAAQALCKTLRYTPARVHERPVACVITLAVEWRLPR
jgi:protein TonB